MNEYEINQSELLMIKENYRQILEEIRNIAVSCGRNPDDITLIAVSKTKPVEYVMQAIDAGAVDFGENKPQELSAKFDEINVSGNMENIRWHQIGHLQRNKVRHIVGKTVLIHSLDSIELAAEIDKRAKAADIVQKVLIQINISGEESKFGIAPCELEEFLNKLSGFKNVKVCGLMTISVKDYTSEQNKELFLKLKELADIHGFDELSMGMTHDYKEAVEAGATMIRVGTAIFGVRNYALKNN